MDHKAGIAQLPLSLGGGRFAIYIFFSPSYCHMAMEYVTIVLKIRKLFCKTYCLSTKYEKFLFESVMYLFTRLLLLRNITVVNNT